jgi:hypothetical protein
MKFYLQWNIVNWITVVLMVATGMLIVGMLASGMRQFAGKSAASADDAA